MGKPPREGVTLTRIGALNEIVCPAITYTMSLNYSVTPQVKERVWDRDVILCGPDDLPILYVLFLSGDQGRLRLDLVLRHRLTELRTRSGRV